jgi:transcriptional regulator with XRE-family HTH domain
MSQGKLAEALGVTFQQVQKYESGTNRMSASRLQEAAHVLQVPIPFFFEDAPNVSGQANIDGNTPSSAHVFDFLATTEGLNLVKAFRRNREAGFAPPDRGPEERGAGEDDA